MLTLHQAKEKVAGIYRREGWGEPKIEWHSPLAAALAAHVESRSSAPLTRNSMAWCEIRRVLLDYHEHVIHTRGQKAATDAILAYADRDMGVPLYSFANDVREGLHLAEST